MSQLNRVVARYLDGKTLKGTTDDFFPNRPSFHLHVSGESRVQEIACSQLKAVFFVKDFGGNSERDDVPGYAEAIAGGLGKKITVQFKDNEMICGYTLSYSTDRTGFFVVPADEGGNNIRVYVLKHATKRVGVGPQADELAKSRGSEAA